MFTSDKIKILKSSCYNPFKYVGLKEAQQKETELEKNLSSESMQKEWKIN